MTNLSASDIAARRIREERTRKGWRVRDLADRCKEAGAGTLTAPVITNLETRRRPGREITAEELLALAFVLEVPPVQLLCPLDGDEVLEVVPGCAKGPLDAAAWLADEDAVLRAVQPAASGEAGDTERALRYRGSPLTVIRQLRAAARSLRVHDRALSSDRWLELTGGTADYHKNSITILSLRILHLAEALEALGYAPPPMPGALEIMARRGYPATLAEWEHLVAEDMAAREARDGAST